MSYHSRPLFGLAVVSVLAVQLSMVLPTLAQGNPPLTAAALGLKVEVATKNAVQQDCHFRPSSFVWGADGECSRVYIWGVRVIDGDNEVFVPLSAFSDLSNPHRLFITLGAKSGEYSITIGGGDAGTGYTAIFVVKARELVSRKVFSNQFPTQAYETTTYVWNRENR
jgi:hypothetical protein